MEDIQAFVSAFESLSMVGFLLLGLRYVDTLRKERKQSEQDRTDDIIADWKRLREVDESQ